MGCRDSALCNSTAHCLFIFIFLLPSAVNELLINWSGVGVDICSQHHLLIVVVLSPTKSTPTADMLSLRHWHYH